MLEEAPVDHLVGVALGGQLQARLATQRPQSVAGTLLVEQAQRSLAGARQAELARPRAHLGPQAELRFGCTCAWGADSRRATAATNSSATSTIGRTRRATLL